ncbi:MAG: peptidyl-prolyl cis-trans isomerase [Gaiellaceae bacterium]
MKRLRLSFLLALVAATLAGCGGGGGGVPGDAIAVVGSQEIAKADFDAMLAQARASYKAQERDLPKVGTPEYNTLKSQIVQYLVQRAQFEEKAEELDIEITDEEVDERLDEIKKQYFDGSEEKFTDQLESQKITLDQVKRDIRAQMIQERLFAKVTEGVKATDKEVRDYYEENKEQYGTPESRDVRHILVGTKVKADDVFAQLQDGGNFAQLAKDLSKDPGSAAQGGKLTVARGQTVPEFDKLAFELDLNEISEPVKTQYGWHVIQAVSAVKPAKVTPFAEVKEQIEQQLLQTKKSEATTKWVEDVRKELEDETAYQVGFAPPETTPQTANQ